jgi:hypothetical protein
MTVACPDRRDKRVKGCHVAAVFSNELAHVSLIRRHLKKYCTGRCGLSRDVDFVRVIDHRLKNGSKRLDQVQDDVFHAGYPLESFEEGRH